MTQTQNEALSVLIAEAEPAAIAYAAVSPRVLRTLAAFLVSYLDERIDGASIDSPLGIVAEDVTDVLIAEAVGYVAQLILDEGPDIIARMRMRALEWMEARPERMARRQRRRDERKALRIARDLGRMPEHRFKPPGAPDVDLSPIGGMRE